MVTICVMEDTMDGRASESTTRRALQSEAKITLLWYTSQ